MTTKVARKPKRVKETAPAYATAPAPLHEIYRLTMTSKGQIVIPAALRRKHGITPKTRIVIYEDGDRIVLKPITHAAIEQLRGKYKGSGMVKALLEERAKDREREDAKFNRSR
jgi:AbrB family looped-hinge helix DNA binding protein